MNAALACACVASAALLQGEVARQETELGGVRAEVTAPAETEVGAAISCTLRFTGPDSASVSLDAPEALGEFDVLGLEPPRREGDATVFVLTLATYAAGEQQPAAIEAKWLHAGDGATGTVEFPKLRITSLLSSDGNGQVDPTKFRDIAGAIELPGPFPWWPWAAGAAAIALAGGVAWWVLRARPQTPLEPDAWALRELARLEGSALPARSEYGRYYDELTGIVRRYVSLRYAIRAQQQTSRELIEAVRAHGEFPADETEQLKSLLKLADLVKFAKAEPTRAECDANLAEARGFVERTKPIRELNRELDRTTESSRELTATAPGAASGREDAR